MVEKLPMTVDEILAHHRAVLAEHAHFAPVVAGARATLEDAGEDRLRAMYAARGVKLSAKRFRVIRDEQLENARRTLAEYEPRLRSLEEAIAESVRLPGGLLTIPVGAREDGPVRARNARVRARRAEVDATLVVSMMELLKYLDGKLGNEFRFEGSRADAAPGRHEYRLTVEHGIAVNLGVAVAQAKKLIAAALKKRPRPAPTVALDHDLVTTGTDVVGDPVRECRVCGTAAASVAGSSLPCRGVASRGAYHNYRVEAGRLLLLCGVENHSGSAKRAVGGATKRPKK